VRVHAPRVQWLALTLTAPPRAAPLHAAARELAKLLAAVQAAVYGGKAPVLTPELWRTVLARKLNEHQERRAFRLGHHGTPGDERGAPAS
jgi:hypothetical protein